MSFKFKREGGKEPSLLTPQGVFKSEMIQLTKASELERKGSEQSHPAEMPQWTPAPPNWAELGAPVTHHLLSSFSESISEHQFSLSSIFNKSTTLAEGSNKAIKESQIILLGSNDYEIIEELFQKKHQSEPQCWRRPWICMEKNENMVFMCLWLALEGKTEVAECENSPSAL